MTVLWKDCRAVIYCAGTGKPLYYIYIPEVWTYTRVWQEEVEMAVIGIDLGTTNSLAAVWRNGRSELIPNAFGEVMTPSVISVNEEGNIYTGKAAKERLISCPENTVSEFKRFIGTNKVYELGGRKYTPEDLSALVLKKIKEDAQAYLGEEVEEAVISVPAYFNNAQRDATKRAGEMAGLLVERIVNEPSAAALACQQMYPEEDTLEAVFDFGGGTLDVSVVDCFENIINVVSVSGDNHLGGCDFDLAMAEHFCEEQKLDYGLLSPSLQAAILKSAENCKKELSDKEQAEMTVFYEGEKKTVLFNTEKMIQVCAGIFVRIREPLKQAAVGAELSWDEIKRIILVGGSCKMPAVRLYLQHFLKKDVMFLGSPDTIVALGAAAYAGIKERKQEIKDMLLTDVCPFTLGVEIEGGNMSGVIERNTALPASKSRLYVTVWDMQMRVKFNIYQGESLKASDNVYLGQVEIPVPPAPAGKEEVEVRFTYDINGILEIDAAAISTGEKSHLLIVDKNNRMSREEVARRLDSMQKIKIHPREDEVNLFLIARGEALYKQAGHRLRKLLTDEIQYFRYLLETQDPVKIIRGRKRFEKALSAAEESMKVFCTEAEFEMFSAGWYEEAKKEEDDFDAWMGKGHLTS